MSKLKKTLLLATAFVLVAAIAVGATFAYLTDRDSKVNTFTVGNVSIKLNEEFQQGAELMPGVNVEKKATITNTGDNEAWVWMTMAIPAALDNSDTSTVGESNALHWNVPGVVWKGYGDDPSWATAEKVANAKNNGFITDEHIDAETGLVKADCLWTICQTEDAPVAIKQQEIDGVTYNVYTFLYNGKLAPDATTPVSLHNVYLDTKVDIDTDGQWYLVNDGTAVDLNWNSNTDGAPKVIVSAYAVQADGFENVEAAYAAYQTQWGDDGAENAPPAFKVSNSEELAAAIEAGETDIYLNDGTYHAPAAAKGKTLTLSGSKNAVLEVVPAGQGEANGQLDYSFDGSNVTFNGITIKTNSQLYAGYARLSGTYNDCVIQNTYNLGTGNSAFYNCTINITNEYLRVGGAYSAVFDGCTFNTDGRAILVFQDGTSVAQTVTVKDCTFNATAAANTWNGIHIAAVSIDGTNGTYTVNLEGNNTVDSDFNGLWQIKAGETNVTVNE